MPRLASAVPLACATILLAAGSARVSGTILLCGGPIKPGHPTTSCFAQNGTVSAIDSHNRLVARERTHRARFSFTLPPGRYTLVAATGGTRGERVVVVHAHQSLRANIVIAVP
jgi:hypothetical protein